MTLFLMYSTRICCPWRHGLTLFCFGTDSTLQLWNTFKSSFCSETSSSFSIFVIQLLWIVGQQCSVVSERGREGGWTLSQFLLLPPPFFFFLVLPACCCRWRRRRSEQQPRCWETVINKVASSVRHKSTATVEDTERLYTVNSMKEKH